MKFTATSIKKTQTRPYIPVGPARLKTMQLRSKRNAMLRKLRALGLTVQDIRHYSTKPNVIRTNS